MVKKSKKKLKVVEPIVIATEESLVEEAPAISDLQGYKNEYIVALNGVAVRAREAARNVQRADSRDAVDDILTNVNDILDIAG